MYFIGFGFPAATLACLCPRLIESGVFSILIPFGIMSSIGVSDRDGRIRVPVFYPSELVAGWIVRLVNWKYGTLNSTL